MCTNFFSWPERIVAEHDGRLIEGVPIRGGPASNQMMMEPIETFLLDSLPAGDSPWLIGTAIMSSLMLNVFLCELLPNLGNCVTVLLALLLAFGFGQLLSFMHDDPKYSERMQEDLREAKNQAVLTLIKLLLLPVIMKLCAMVLLWYWSSLLDFVEP